jgi:hypothetical protein
LGGKLRRLELMGMRHLAIFFPIVEARIWVVENNSWPWMDGIPGKARLV